METDKAEMIIDLIEAQSKSTNEIWDNKDDEVWNEQDKHKA